MITIRSQVIATTAIDSYGEAIPRDALKELFQRMPDPWLLFFDHDPSKPPIARASNKQFVQLENDKWAICADVDILDESKFRSCGGFSISYSDRHYSVNLDRSPEITLTAR